MSTWSQLAPLLVVAIGGFALMLVDALGSDDSSELATLASVICFAAAAVAFVIATGTKAPAPLPPGITPWLAFDNLTHFLTVVVCTGAGMCALLAGGYLREHALERGEFYALLLLSAFGAIVLAASTDLPHLELVIAVRNEDNPTLLKTLQGSRGYCENRPAALSNF